MKYNKRKMEQFSEWIPKLYPEIKTYEENSELRLLSRTFTFQVTDACNLACTYCYQINKGVRRMSFETAKLAVDKLLSGDDGFDQYIDPKKVPAIILEFIGGEPFLEIDLIDKIVDYFRLRTIELDHPWKTKFIISICSNGVLYKDPKVQNFLQKNRDVISFNVTVDGTKELHDACRVFPNGAPSYDLAHFAATDWMNRGYLMGSKITIAPGNVQYFADCMLALIEDGYYQINANCVYEYGWTLEHAQELYKQCKIFTDKFHKKYNIADYQLSLFTDVWGMPLSEENNDNWCGGTGYMLAIDPDGYLYPCLRYMDSSLGKEQKPMIIGNVFDGLMKKQCEKDCINCLSKINRRSQSTDECFYCPIATGCGWCSAYNYQVYGTANKRVTAICEMNKARALALTYFYNSYYKKNNINEVHDLWVPKQWAVPIIGEEEYNMLVELTSSLGGYINEDATMVKVENEILPDETSRQKLTILSRE